MKPIQPNQIKAIYASGNKLGMCDRTDRENDMLHLLIHRTTGKNSVKELSYTEALVVIKELRKLEIPESKMSTGQRSKAWALFYQLKELSPSEASDGERMAGIVTKVTGVSCSRKNPFVWLGKKQGNDVIEMLKRYIATEKNKLGKE